MAAAASSSSAFDFKSFISHSKVELVRDDNNSINKFVEKLIKLNPSDKTANSIPLQQISRRLSEMNIPCDIFSDELPKSTMRHSKKTISKFSKFLNKFLDRGPITTEPKKQRKPFITYSSPGPTSCGTRTTFPHNDLIYQIVSQTIYDCLNPSLLDSQMNVTFIDMLDSFENALDDIVKIQYEEFLMLIYTCLSDHSWNFPGFNSPPDRKKLSNELVEILKRMSQANGNSNGSGGSNSNGTSAST